MKIQLFCFSLFFALSLSIMSCGHSHNNGHSHDQDGVEKTSKEYTSEYICPMYCKGSGSDKEGKCPVCGMDYIKNKKKDQHDHDHDGHDHSDHDHDGDGKPDH